MADINKLIDLEGLKVFKESYDAEIDEKISQIEIDVDVDELTLKVDALDQAIGQKVDRVDGKQLSTNDFTNDYKNQLDNLPTSFAPTDAQSNVIESVKINDVALTPSEKTVNISVPTEQTIAEWGFVKSDYVVLASSQEITTELGKYFSGGDK